MARSVFLIALLGLSFFSTPAVAEPPKPGDYVKLGRWHFFNDNPCGEEVGGVHKNIDIKSATIEDVDGNIKTYDLVANVPMAEDDAFRKGIALASRVGVELVVTTVVGAGLGYGLDRWLGTGPWLMIVGVWFGVS